MNLFFKRNFLKRLLIFLFIGLFAYWIIGLFVRTTALALTMSNAFYIIVMGNLNSIAGNTSGPSNKLSITSGETGSGLYSLFGVNYQVKGGFQYVRPHNFSFKITSPAVNFGILTAGTSVNRTSNLIVSNYSAYGYIVTAMQATRGLLDPASGIKIPDTTCDNGLCTTSSATAWVLNADGTSTTYGFGYNCTNVSGTECPADFTGPTLFRPFSASPSATTVMSNTNVGTSQNVQITYRVNVSATQGSGLYTDVITYIATPTF